MNAKCAIFEFVLCAMRISELMFEKYDIEG